MKPKNDSTLSAPFNPIKKVLIAIDYNATAEKVANGGYLLAKSMNAEVILLHVLSTNAYYSTLEQSPTLGYSNFSSSEFFLYVDRDQIKEAAQYYLDETTKHLGDPKIISILKEGDFATEVLKTAEETQADLIVMGSHSRRWLEQILMGSVTEKVLHKTTIPLFIIPTKGVTEE